MNVYNIFIHTCQNLEATKIFSVSARMSELWCIQTMEDYLALNKHEL
jgi:hypothetical protein